MDLESYHELLTLKFNNERLRQENFKLRAEIEKRKRLREIELIQAIDRTEEQRREKKILKFELGYIKQIKEN